MRFRPGRNRDERQSVKRYIFFPLVSMPIPFSQPARLFISLYLSGHTFAMSFLCVPAFVLLFR